MNEKAGNGSPPPAGYLVELVGRRAENVYEARGFCCSEAVVWVLNETFQGGLEPEGLLRLASGFCHGMGGAGCVCGALAGAQMGLGLYLGPHGADGLHKKEFRKTAQVLHDRFKEKFGDTCCRVLLKMGKEKKGASCKALTGGAAELAIELLLAQRPELAAVADQKFLAARDTKAGSLLRKAMGKGSAVA